jgi:hypothetical protein
MTSIYNVPVYVANRFFNEVTNLLATVSKRNRDHRLEINHDLKAVSLNLATGGLAVVLVLAALRKVEPIQAILVGGICFFVRQVIDRTFDVRSSASNAGRAVGSAPRQARDAFRESRGITPGINAAVAALRENASEAIDNLGDAGAAAAQSLRSDTLVKVAGYIILRRTFFIFGR